MSGKDDDKRWTKPSLIEHERDQVPKTLRNSAHDVMTELPIDFLQSPEFLRQMYGRVEDARNFSMMAERRADEAAIASREAVSEIQAFAKLAEADRTKHSIDIEVAKKYFSDVSKDMAVLRAEIEPVLKTRANFGRFQAFILKTIVVLGGLGGILKGVEYVIELIHKMKGV